MAIDYNELGQYSKEDTSLRDYQQDNKQKIYEAWSQYQSVMLQMPTGTGKTRLFVSLIKDLFNYSRNHKEALKVLILVHRTELIEQIDEELGFRYGMAHGIIQSGDKERRKYPIQLASVQTLSRRLNNWTDKDFDFVIVDEAHHITADSYQKIIKAFPNAKLLGVTATPVRMNGEGFTETFDELITSPSVKWFIEKGFLSQYDYYSVARSSFIQQQVDSIKKFSQGDYAESELERICDNDRIRAQIVKTYLDFANGKKGIVYTINKLHNKNLCAEFNEKGIKTVAIDSDTPSELREQYIEQFRRGEFLIICNVNLFTEGFDCPDIEFIQLARPTKSLALYLQQVGRGLRVSENKENVLFLDNVGLYNRFGFPSSRRMWKHHFEGRYKGNNAAEEDEEKEIKTSIFEGVIRNRRQNLEEGNEKIHLIQTTEEKEYLEERKKQLIEWLEAYHKANCEAYDKAFRLNYIDGLGLSLQKTKLGFSGYSVFLKEITKPIQDTLNNRKYHFSEYEENNLIKEEERNCKSIDELLSKIDDSVWYDKDTLFKNDFNLLINQYKELNFTEAELMDLMPEIKNAPFISCSPQYAEEKTISYTQIIQTVCEGLLGSFSIRKMNLMLPLIRAFFYKYKEE